MIGRAVAARLHEDGYDVSALSLTWSAPLPVADRLFTGDAGDEALVAEALGDVSGVVHMAAIPHPNLGTPREVFVGNTAATFTVLNTAGERGIRRVVLASSINAFGIPMNRHDVQPAYYPLDEASPVAHDDAYSLSKWVDEQTAAWAGSRFGMTVVALRFPLVRPLEDLREHAQRLRSLPDERRRLAREGWAYLELDDAVQAIRLGLEAPITGVHTAIVAAEDILLDEPTEELLDRYVPRSERRARFAGHEAPLDTRVARTLLGWTPRRSIRDADPIHNPPLEEVTA
jgi:nucleoside-diphosphate-sugar epimerase